MKKLIRNTHIFGMSNISPNGIKDMRIKYENIDSSC